MTTTTDDMFGTTCTYCEEAIDDVHPWGVLEDGDPVHLACCDGGA